MAISTTIRDFLRGLTQGMSFGLADEALSGLRAGFAFNAAMRRTMSPEMQAYIARLQAQGPEGRRKAALLAKAALRKAFAETRSTWGRSMALENARIRQARERSPWASMAGELAGAVASPATLGSAKLLSKFAPATAPLLQRMGVSAALGAVEGGLYGAASARGNLAERAQKAIGPAVVGGAIGAALPPVQDALGAAAGWARRKMMEPRRVGVEGVSDNTARWLAREMAQQGDPGAAVAAAKEMQNITAPGLPPSPSANLHTLMDVHPTARFYGEQIVQSASPARATIQGALRKRFTGADRRMRQVMDKAIAPAEDIFAKIDDMVAQTRRRAAPYYDAAYQQMVPVTQEFLDGIATPTGRRAIRRAISMLGEWGRQADVRGLNMLMTALTDKKAKPPERLSVAQIDALKRALDDIVGAAERQGRNSAAAAAKRIRDLVLSEARTVPEYNQARAIAKSYKDIESAFELGQKALYRSAETQPELFARRVAQMQPEEKEALRQGLRVAISQATDWLQNPAARARNLTSAPARAKNLRAALGVERGDYLARSLAAERRYADTYNEVLGNSATARRIDSMFREFAGLDAKGIAANAVRKLLDIAQGRSQEAFKDELARLLVDTGANRDAVLRAMLQYARSYKAGSKAAEVARQRLIKALRVELAAPTANRTAGE